MQRRPPLGPVTPGSRGGGLGFARTRGGHALMLGQVTAATTPRVVFHPQLGVFAFVSKRVKRTISARAGVPVVDPRQLALEIVEQMRTLTAKATHTFKELADLWLKNNSARLVAPANEWRHIRHLKELWDCTEETLTAEAVAGALVRLPETIGPTTKNKIRSTGKRVVASAQASRKWGQINPFALAPRQKETKRKYRTLTLDEICRVLPHLRPDRRRLVKVALVLGMRPGELLGLKKKSVDVETRTILVQRSHHRDTTKTDAWREIPVPESVWRDLEAAMAEGSSDYVFPRADGRRMRRDTKLARMLRTAMSKAGLVQFYRYSCRRKGCGHKEQRPHQEEIRCPKCDFKLWAHGVPLQARFYDLRHGAATLHRRAGADPLAIKLTLGHANRDTTDDVYTHLTDEDVRRELSKLELKQEASQVNTRTEAWEARALPTELPPQNNWPGVETQPLLTVKDLAERLRVKPRTVYALVEEGAIRCVRIGSLIRFEPEAVIDFIARRRQ